MKYSVPLAFLLLLVNGCAFLNALGENVTTLEELEALLLADGNLDAEITELNDDDLVNKIIFYLHTVQNPAVSDAQEIWIDDVETLSQSYFDPSIPTRIIIHGWMSSATSEMSYSISDAYLEHGAYNVIVVDWSTITDKSYLYARGYVQVVGTYVAKMIDFLVAQGVNTTEMIIIGHSLGAHVAGLAARQADSTVGYLMALDPALPLFLLADSANRVAKGDAEFVQVIHTNAGVYGYLTPIGDVDFYPNGGNIQPGCIFNSIDINGCSHGLSYKFFAESINSDIGFWATQCINYVRYTLGTCRNNKVALMGGAEPTVEATGKYYLRTETSSPYAKGAA